MKKIVIMLLLAPTFSWAQDCAIKREKDQFSQQDRITTGFMQLTNCRLSVTADSKELDFFFSVTGGKCFDDATTLSVVFADGRTKTMFRNTGSMNCEGLFHFTLRNTPTSNTNLTRLETKSIQSFTFANGKNTTAVLLNEKQQQQIKTAIACLSKEAKTLIAKP